MKTVQSGSASLKVLAVLVVAAFAGIVAVNALAVALPLNGVPTGQLSDEIPNLFVPAGLTFSIWGVIYLLLLGYSVAVVREAWRGNGKGTTWNRDDAVLFLVNAAANMAWIFAWHWRQVGLAMAIMLVILATLIALEQRSQARLARGGALRAKGVGAVRRFFLTAPLRVYLGWISVATIANATALLVKLGWNGFGLDPRVWTVAVIAAGLVVALGFTVGKRGIAAPLVVVWAYAGIVIKRTGADAAYSTVIWGSAIAAAAIIMLSMVVVRLRKAG